MREARSLCENMVMERHGNDVEGTLAPLKPYTIATLIITEIIPKSGNPVTVMKNYFW